MPWAAPVALVMSLASSSKNREDVVVMGKTPSRYPLAMI
jgi:hypothetical protein